MGMFQTSIEVNAPVEECFDMWACPDCLTRFMRMIECAELKENQLVWHWRLNPPQGEPICWDTAIDILEDQRLISWHSMDHAPADASGAVQFEAVHPDLTRMNIEIMMNPPIQAGDTINELFGKRVEQTIFEDLDKLERILNQEKREFSHRKLPEKESLLSTPLGKMSGKEHIEAHIET